MMYIWALACKRLTGTNSLLILYENICIWLMPCLVTLCYLKLLLLALVDNVQISAMWIWSQTPMSALWIVCKELMKCAFPGKTKKHFTPVPGWNEYLSQPYDESRQAYIICNSYNMPRSGPVHELMKRTRARFKYAQRLVQKNAARRCLSKQTQGLRGCKMFLKNVKKTATREQ